MRNSKTFMLSLGVLFTLISLSSAQSYSMPSAVRNHMATRQMRYHHYLWHQLRDNWNRFSSQTQQSLSDIGWRPTNPSRDSRGNRISNNLSGEDFLFMHRQMIQTARRVASQNGQSTSFAISWSSIPAPGDRTYPVPPAFTRGSSRNTFASFKTNSHYETMRRQEQRLKDPNVLRRMSLNDLGREIESGGMHTSLHYRWSSSSSVGYRGGSSSNNGIPNIGRQWDSVSYDWMGDSYASHVNPLFWRLHGWIDDRVEDWRRANGLGSIRWRGTWVGGPMSNLGSVARKVEGGVEPMEENDDPEAVSEGLQKAFEIFQKSGVREFTMEDAERIDRRNRRKMLLKRVGVCKKNRASSLSKKR